MGELLCDAGHREIGLDKGKLSRLIDSGHSHRFGRKEQSLSRLLSPSPAMSLSNSNSSKHDLISHSRA